MMGGRPGLAALFSGEGWSGVGSWRVKGDEKMYFGKDDVDLAV